MIKNLTEKQEQELVEFRNEWLQIGESTEPVDRDEIQAVMKEFYKRSGFSEPEFKFCDSPFAAQAKLYELAGKKGTFYSPFFFGRSESYWIAYYLFGNQIGAKYEPEQMELLDLWVRLAKTSHIIWTFDGLVVCSEAPVGIHWDTWRGENNLKRLHRADGPAVEYKDGTGLYVYHGIRVSREIVMEPITLAQIKKESNAEVRRVMLDIFGWERWLGESGMMPIHEDRFGVLYRYEDQLGPRLMVMVTNSTQEPDGTYKKFVLRVPRQYRDQNGRIVDITWPIETAHAAVAATFGKRPEEYMPSVES